MARARWVLALLIGVVLARAGGARGEDPGASEAVELRLATSLYERAGGRLPAAVTVETVLRSRTTQVRAATVETEVRSWRLSTRDRILGGAPGEVSSRVVMQDVVPSCFTRAARDFASRLPAVSLGAPAAPAAPAPAGGPEKKPGAPGAPQPPARLPDPPPTPAERRARLEDAVIDGLRWLAAHQSEDGRWESAGFDRWCDGTTNAGDRPDGPGKAMVDVGVTGLALSAFLGAGFAASGEHEFAGTVRRGLTYLKSVQDADGCFGSRSTQHFIYSHGAAALAMLEAYGKTHSVVYRDSVQKALDFIALARNPGFAWRYGVKPGDNDTSVTGAMIRVLLQARRINEGARQKGEAPLLKLDDAADEGIRAWINKVTEPEFGRVGYTQRGQGPARPPELVDRFPNHKSESMTAIGLLARVYLGEVEARRDVVEKGVALCLSVLPVWDETDGSIDMYYWAYATAAMAELGGDAWARWAGALYPMLLARQRSDGTYCSFKGSWDPADPWGADGGRVYSTALLVRCLTLRGG